MSAIYLAGQRLTADLLNLTVPTVYAKPTNEARTSTASSNNDSDLAGITLGPGLYEVEAVIFCFNTNSSVPGIRTAWGFSGTWNGTTTNRQCIGPGSSNTAGSTIVTPMVSRGLVMTADSLYGLGSGSSLFSIREICRNMQVTATGNLGFQWGQQTSNANATTVAANSTVTVRQIG